MRLLFILLFIIPFSISCSHKKQEKDKYETKNIINHKEMVNIITDCYIAESALINISQDNGNLKLYSRYYYDYIFKKYNTNRNQFIESMKYYSFHIKELSKIYNEVGDNLANLQNIKEYKKPTAEE